MVKADLVAFALESAISTQLGLFGLFLLTKTGERAAARYLFAAATLCVALMIAGNLVIRAAGLQQLGDFVLFLDLLGGPLVYLYVRQMRSPAPPMRFLDAAYALPAGLGIAAWELGLLRSMDVYLNACWLTSLAAAMVYFVHHRQGYAPPARMRSLIILLATFGLISVLRILVILNATPGSSFLNGIPYLLVLAAIFGATCHILFTALRQPALLSVPGSHLKYARSGSSEAELESVDAKLQALLAEHRPYLNPDLTVLELAALLGVPARTLSQLINARRGMNFAAYMNFCRIQTAAELLVAKPDEPIKRVMYESGFRSKSLFSHEFRRHQGVTPSEFRQRGLRGPGSFRAT
jgi:AraC-like DNA-binding protein